jgi:hypothetical protein
MIVLIKDNLNSKEFCKNTINFYKKNKNKAKKFRDVFPLDLKKEDLEIDFINKIHNISKTINNSIIDWAQIVYWPKNSFQDFHFDNTSNKTTLSSICYLNDNYEGGQTYFEDGTIFTPITGRVLLHGVKKIISGNRYVLATWYKNDQR